MNKQEAAEYLGISVRTLQRLTAQGEISAGEVRGKTGMVTDYAKEELDRFKQEEERKAQDATRYVRPHVTPVTPDNATPAQTALALGRAGNSPALVELITALEQAHAARTQPVPVFEKLTLSLAEASQLSGLSRNHLRQAIEEKKLKARIIGRGWRVKREDLEAYVKKL
jgi:excisionase family DNA binding protein